MGVDGLWMVLYSAERKERRKKESIKKRVSKMSYYLLLAEKCE